MKNPIIEIFTGTQIDLSKILGITKVVFINAFNDAAYTRGGYYASFKIYLEGQEEPWTYTREFKKEVEYWYRHSHGDMTRHIAYGKDGKTPLAVERLQKEADKIVEAWKTYKESAIENSLEEKVNTTTESELFSEDELDTIERWYVNLLSSNKLGEKIDLTAEDHQLYLKIASLRKNLLISK